MRVSDAIRQRRSVKYFDPDHRLAPADVDELLALARLSPTAFNIQNWRFVRVVDPATRRAIRAAAWDQPQMTDAALLLVLCFDLRAWDREPERYWRNAPPAVAAQLVPEIRAFYAADAQLQRDEGQRSCGIAAQTLMLAAAEMGLASRALADQAVADFQVNSDRLEAALAANPILVTALNERIGYDQGAAIAKQAYAEGRAIIDVAEECTDIPRAELEQLLDPRKLTGT